MREIKFRAYIKEFTEMLEVEYLHVIAEEVEVRRFPNVFTSLFSYAKEIKNAELMQYTGLKDSKGVEIYENDIVKYRERNLEKAFGYEKGGDDYNNKVKLIEFRNQSFNVPGGFIKDLEVIGNRFENPELL